MLTRAILYWLQVDRNTKILVTNMWDFCKSCWYQYYIAKRQPSSFNTSIVVRCFWYPVSYRDPIRRIHKHQYWDPTFSRMKSMCKIYQITSFRPPVYLSSGEVCLASFGNQDSHDGVKVYAFFWFCISCFGSWKQYQFLSLSLSPFCSVGKCWERTGAHPMTTSGEQANHTLIWIHDEV